MKYGKLNEKRDIISMEFEVIKGQKQRIYDTLSMITMMDDGKNFLIIIVNTGIMGEWLKGNFYDLEVDVKGWNRKMKTWLKWSILLLIKNSQLK